MTYGFGRGLARGFGTGRGMGFGFRGSSPPWPYVGRGRGGLPRCAYFLGGAGQSPYPIYPETPTKEEELNFLKTQATAIKEELEQIEASIRNLEGGN